MIQIKFKKTSSDILVPKYQTLDSAAFDLHAAVNEETILNSGEIKLIPTGLVMEIPKGYFGEITPRSGLALKHGISIVNSPGLIDSDYRGEVGIILINLGKDKFVINRHDRIAQMSIRKYESVNFEEVNFLSATPRGESGFGSTGKSPKDF